MDCFGFRNMIALLLIQFKFQLILSSPHRLSNGSTIIFIIYFFNPKLSVVSSIDFEIGAIVFAMTRNTVNDVIIIQLVVLFGNGLIKQI